MVVWLSEEYDNIFFLVHTSDNERIMHEFGKEIPAKPIALQFIINYALYLVADVYWDWEIDLGEGNAESFWYYKVALTAAVKHQLPTAALSI